jgi:NDP-sugar pyrophosphorylase family protein
MKILVIAGGLATRMRPIAEDVPKCMVDIKGKPLIHHQLEVFKRQGFDEIIFCVAHLADEVKGYFKDGSSLGLSISYVQDGDTLMGTAGSVKLAEGLIGADEDFIVYYGDTLTTMDLNRFMDYHKKKGAIATIALHPLKRDYKSSSLICLGEDSKVSIFNEKPTTEEFQKYRGEKCYVNSGIYALDRRVLGQIPKGERYDFGKHLFPRFIERGMDVRGYVSGEFFREIGRMEKYQAFLEEVKCKEDIFS